MREDFEVIEISSDSMTLKANRESSCNVCASKGVCGTGILSGLFGGYSLFKKPLNNGVKEGDIVTLEISSKELFSRAMQLYLFPILGLFAGAYLSELIFPLNDIVQALMGLSAFLLVLLLLRVLIK